MNDIEKSELDTQVPNAQDQKDLEKKQRKEELKDWFYFRKKEFVKNCNIVKQLVIRSVKVQYRNSVIGIFWTILNPLLNMLVMYLVFSNMFGRSAGTTPTDGDTYALYLLCGNIIFGMMRTSTYQALPSLVQNRGLLTKNKISYNVFPLSHTLSAMVNFGFSFIALLGVMFVVWLQGQAVFSLNIFLIFVMMPGLFLFCYGLSLILSALYTFFRDIMHFYNVFLTLWMYLTPIFYGISVFENRNDFLSSFMCTIIKCNPMYYFVEFFRAVVYRCSAHEGAIQTLTEQIATETNAGTLNTLTATLADTVELAQLPGFGDVAVLYAIGGVATLIGAIVFMCTKRRFIYNI